MITKVLDKVDKLRASGRQAPRVAIPADCDTTIDEVGAYLSGDLDGVRRDRFVEHIRNCSKCHDKLLVLELALNLGQGVREATPAEQLVVGASDQAAIADVRASEPIVDCAAAASRGH
jgi:predicted anti-sigma-YlaC factor YlaD